MVTPETTLSPDDQLDAGFKAAKDWFFANEVELEERELALARTMARLLRIRPEVLYGKTRYAQQRLQAVDERADAEGWSDEMRKIERRREIRLAIQHFRQIPWVEQAIGAAQRDRELPMHVMAALPAALSKVKKDYPNAAPQKGLVVHEIKRLLKMNLGRCVSERRIAQALPQDFTCRD